jgi:hypothetical protein
VAWDQQGKGRDSDGRLMPAQQKRPGRIRTDLLMSLLIPVPVHPWSKAGKQLRLSRISLGTLTSDAYARYVAIDCVRFKFAVLTGENLGAAHIKTPILRLPLA